MPPVIQVISATQGTGLFSRLMQLAVGLAIGTDGIEITLLSYLIPCVAADWGLSTLEQGSLTASVFAGELVSGSVSCSPVTNHRDAGTKSLCTV